MLVEIGARISALGKHKEITVKTNIADETILVVGAEERLGEAILAISENAIKYCEAGDSVQLSLSADDGFAIILIEDDGPGISKEDQPFIFERFYRSRTSGQVSRGSGLGLAIAKGIVDSHGGKLELKHSDMSGTTFVIRLPRA
jgi:signal transduction histidine kinase